MKICKWMRQNNNREINKEIKKAINLDNETVFIRLIKMPQQQQDTLFFHAKVAKDALCLITWGNAALSMFGSTATTATTATSQTTTNL